MEYKFPAAAALMLLSSGRTPVDAYSNTANHLMSRRRSLNGARFVSSIENPAGEGTTMDEANGLTDDQNNMAVDNLMMIGFQNTNAESCISDHSAAAMPLLFPAPDIPEDRSDTDANFFRDINENAEEAYTRELIQASVDENHVQHQPDPPQLERQIALKPVVSASASASANNNSSGVKDILKFAIPAIGVWLCGPLLSMIDTAAVGLLSGTANQAALSPAVAVTEYSTLLLAFLYTATTNLVASAQEEEKNISGKPLTSKTLISAIQVSFFAGIGLSAVLMLFSKSLLKAIIGNETISAAVFAPALRYVRIRALGLPAAAIIGTAQAACLGMKDIKAPFYVLVAAALVNFFGDAIFVGSKSPWIGGAAGAAWATVFSQYAALAFFFKWLLYKKKADKAEGLKVSTGDDENINGTTETPKVVNLSEKIIESTSPGIQEFNGDLKLSSAMLEPASANNIIKTGRLRSIGSAKNKRKWIKSRLSSFSTKKQKRNEEKIAPEPFTTKGFLNGQLKIQDAAKVPSKVSIAEFMPYVLPVTASSVGRVSMYVAMNYVVSSTLGTSAMAAQQIILSIFYCLCPIADSLNLTAQSFIPPIYGKKKTKDRTANLQKMIKDFVKTGIIFGSVMSSMVAGIPLISGLFTTDPVVISTVNGVVPLLMGIFSVHGFVMGGEGILLGQKDLSFLGGAFSLFFALVPFMMISKKRAVGDALTLNGLWHVFAGYQIARLAIWWTRIMFLSRKMTQETANLPLRILDDYGFSEDSVGRPLNVIEGLNVDNIDTPDELLVKAPSFG